MHVHVHVHVQYTHVAAAAESEDAVDIAGRSGTCVYVYVFLRALRTWLASNCNVLIYLQSE